MHQLRSQEKGQEVSNAYQCWSTSNCSRFGHFDSSFDPIAYYLWSTHGLGAASWRRKDLKLCYWNTWGAKSHNLVGIRGFEGNLLQIFAQPSAGCWSESREDDWNRKVDHVRQPSRVCQLGAWHLWQVAIWYGQDPGRQALWRTVR